MRLIRSRSNCTRMSAWARCGAAPQQMRGGRGSGLCWQHCRQPAVLVVAACSVMQGACSLPLASGDSARTLTVPGTISLHPAALPRRLTGQWSEACSAASSCATCMRCTTSMVGWLRCPLAAWRRSHSRSDAAHQPHVLLHTLATARQSANRQDAGLRNARASLFWHCVTHPTSRLPRRHRDAAVLRGPCLRGAPPANQPGAPALAGKQWHRLHLLVGALCLKFGEPFMCHDATPPATAAQVCSGGVAQAAAAHRLHLPCQPLRQGGRQHHSVSWPVIGR